MANTTINVAPSGANTASFRAWGSALSGALTTLGLTQVATDINWATVNKPGSANTNAGYEVWKFADPGDATAPDVYLLLRYGTGPSSVSHPGLRVSVGTGWTSADTITGPGSSTEFALIGNGTDATSRVSWLSYDGDGLAIAHSYAGAAGVRFFLAVDRQRRGDGLAAAEPDWPSPIGIGVIVHSSTLASNSGGLLIDPAGGLSHTISQFPAIGPGSFTATRSLKNTSNEVAMLPLIINTRQGAYFSKMALGYPIFDILGDVQITQPYLGASRTYRTIGSTITGFDHQGSAGAGIAMWWEDP